MQEFALKLEDNIFKLYDQLRGGTYQHGSYEAFVVHDPKRRQIHKASVADRLLHHAIVRVIEPFFERQFIFDSWSCRKRKGTHRAVDRFSRMAWKLSRNNTKTVWVLKLDIAKFFASVDQEILLSIIGRTIHDQKTLELIADVVRSFSDGGFPLGNLTSQLFANVYLNELDQFVKHYIVMRQYVRYCDDFVLLHHDRAFLEKLLPVIGEFLETRLRLSLHPKKIILKRYHRGVDFLGYICFPNFRILRTTTKRRMLRKVDEKNLPSYLGLTCHCRASALSHTMREKIIHRGCEKNAAHLQ